MTGVTRRHGLPIRRVPWLVGRFVPAAVVGIIAGWTLAARIQRADAIRSQNLENASAAQEFALESGRKPLAKVTAASPLVGDLTWDDPLVHKKLLTWEEKAALITSIERSAFPRVVELARQSAGVKPPYSEGSQILLRCVFRRLGREAPANAVGVARTLPPAIRSKAAEVMAGSLARHAPGLFAETFSWLSAARQSMLAAQLALLVQDFPDDSEQRRIVMETVSRIPDFKRNFENAVIWRELAKTSSAELLQQLQSGRWMEYGIEWREMALDQILTRDRSAILSLAEAVESNELGRSPILAAGIGDIAVMDPEQAARFLSQAGKQTVNSLLNSDGTPSLIERAPALADEVVRLVPGGEIKPATAAAIARALAADGRALDLSVLQQLSPTSYAASVRDWISVRAQDDPTAAWESLGELRAKRSPPPDTCAQITAEIGEALAHRDPVAAAQWARGIVTPLEAIEVATSSTYEVWSRQDPAAAARSLNSQPLAVEALPAIEAVASNWAAYDADAAFAWVHELPEPFRAGGIARIVSAIRDPGASSTAFGEMIVNLPEEYLKAANLSAKCKEMISSLASQSPTDAINWAGSLPASTFRQESLDLAAKRWAEVDPVGLSEWLSGQPPSQERDYAIASLVSNVPDDNESTFVWAQSMSPGELRLRVLKDVFVPWLQQNRTAAVSAFRRLPAADQGSLGGLLKTDTP